jgi:hypothetical protein
MQRGSMTTDTILKNATAEELANAVEENVFAMFRSMVQALNGQIEETPKNATGTSAHRP